MTETLEANKVIAQRFFEELLNAGNLAVADEIFAPDLINYGTPAAPNGAELFVRVLAAIMKVFPERHYTIHDLVAEDDRVVARVTLEATHLGEPDMPVYGGSLSGIAPTGRSFRNQHMHIFRIRDGRIVEHWGARDDLGMLEQLGLA